MTIASLDVGGTAIKAALLRGDGQCIVQREHKSLASQGVSVLLEQIYDIVNALGMPDRLGVSISGQVEPGTGEIRFATDSFPEFTGTPLRAILRKKLGIPVFVDNDVNCTAIGELHYGAGQGYTDFLCVTYGTGIGGAMIQNNKIYYGFKGSAGEFGHIITHAGNGLPCVCGSRGCYEMYGSASALASRVEKACKVKMDGREIFSRFDDPVIRKEIDGWIGEIIYGLVSLTHIFNPSVFILGGGVLAEDYVLDQIRIRLNSALIPSFRVVEVKRARLGSMAGVMGAFYKALNDII